MKHWAQHNLFTVLLIALIAFFMIGGCDTGEKVIDEATGNQAVKQFHKSQEDIESIADQQAERYGKIEGDDEEQDDENE